MSGKGKMGHQKQEQHDEHLCECGSHYGRGVHRVLVLKCVGRKMRRVWTYRHPDCYSRATHRA